MSQYMTGWDLKAVRETIAGSIVPLPAGGSVSC